MQAKELNAQLPLIIRTWGIIDLLVYRRFKGPTDLPSQGYSVVKTELIRRIAALNSDLPVEACRLAVDTFFEAMIENLENGGSVELRGFGHFFTITKEESRKRNPRTGAAVAVPRGNKIRFRPGKHVNLILNSPF